MTIKILDPTIAADHAETTMAKRVADLDGKVLGLLSNRKSTAIICSGSCARSSRRNIPSRAS